MNDLQARARLAIDAARSGHDPSAADAARVRAALKARVLAEPLLIQPTPAAARGVLGKMALALGVGSSIGFVAGLYAAQALWPGVLARPAESDGTDATSRAAVPTTPAARVEGGPARVSDESRAARADDSRAARAADFRATPTVVAAADPPSASAPPPARRQVAAPETSMASAEKARMSPIQAELDGLRSAQELLHRGRPAWALARLDELDRAGVSAVLLEERAATRAIAECQLGSEGQRVADAYARRYPSSAHLERVRASCAGATPLGAAGAAAQAPARKITPAQTESRGSQHEK